jgi:Skp family chaperone for outer membrane proteins
MFVRMQSPLALFTALGLGMTLAAGCNRQQGAPQHAAGVGVIDLDAIAQRLGSDKQIVAAIDQRRTSLSQQVVELAKSYSQQITDRKKTLNESDAELNKVTLANWQQQANANLTKVKQQAELDLQQHRAKLVEQFRAQIKPAVRRVADARGISVIVTKNDSVLYDFSAAADITEAVIAELQGAPAVAAMP